jgi:hypothetical protein
MGGVQGLSSKNVTKLMSPDRCQLWFSWFTGAPSLKLYVLADRFTLWWLEKDKGEKIAWFNWRVKSVNLVLSSV